MSASDRGVGHAPTASVASPAVPAWVAVMAVGLLTGLQPLSTDLYLPALPEMQRALSLTSPQVQWTLSVLIMAFGLGQLVWGPVADRVGRQPVLRWGLGLYALASAAATFAPDLSVVLLARIAQGASLSAAVVCGRAMIRDLYPPEEGAKVMTKGMGLLGVLALLGPVVGAVAATLGGWRATMALLLLFSSLILLFIWRQLPETLPAHRRQPPQSWPTLVSQWWQISKHPTFRAHTLLTSSTYGGLYVYLALSAFAFIDVLHTSRTTYGVIMATLSLAYLGGTFVCRRALHRIGLIRTIRIGGWLSLSGGLGIALVAGAQFFLGWGVHPVALLPGMWLYAVGHGIHQPCGQTGVVAAFPKQAGAASALSGFILASTAFVVGAGLSWWTSLPGWAGTLYPMTLGMGLGGVCTAWVALRRVQRDGLPRRDA